ncbi:MAG TPA: caspase domain-containing protein [Hyphomicrobiaceae bacterium]|nr:caspase domain-containing protein [Hyphomicrobiaceae bacterium]
MGSEGTSLTEAVRDAAGISLTKAVKDAAGRGPLVPDDGPAGEPSRARAVVGALTQAPPAAPSKFAVLTLLLTLVLLLASFALVVLPVARAPVSEAELANRAPTPGRVALVIGNAAYRYSARLENPRNDATDMSIVLRRKGFRVVEGFDLAKAAFDAKIREFSEAVRGAEVGLLFYAGHGIQVSGQNYLVPIDAKLTTAAALDMEMVRLDLLHRTMEREARTSILFFDACRDNPLARTLARSMGSQSPEVGQGLAAIESGAGTLISFSTQPGNVALDGKGRNSPYSGALIRQLSTSTEDLNWILIAVRNDVMRQTEQRQVPWEHSALTRRFYFGPGGQPAAFSRVAQLRASEAQTLWSAIKDTSSLALVDAFAARYSETVFAELARARAQQLRGGTARPGIALEAEPAFAFEP